MVIHLVCRVVCIFKSFICFIFPFSFYVFLFFLDELIEGNTLISPLGTIISDAKVCSE